MRMFLVLVLAAAAVAQTTPDPQAIVDNFREAYNNSNYQAFVRDFTPALKTQYDEKKMVGFFIHALAGWGKWQKTEEIIHESERAIRAKVHFAETTRMLSMRFDVNGKVEDFAFNEIIDPDFNDPPTTSTFFRFPLQGTWLVLAGGDPETYTAAGRTLQNAFALELVKTTQGRMWRTGQETKNAQFAAYDQEVAAPVGGKIIQLVDAIPENAPGTPNAFAPEGNALVIHYGPRQYLALMHLKGGSLAVKAGQEITPGQGLGRIGNSGAALYPRLVMNVSTDVLGQKGQSRKFGFACVEVQDGETWTRKENYYPATGDLLRPCAE